MKTMWLLVPANALQRPYVIQIGSVPKRDGDVFEVSASDANHCKRLVKRYITLEKIGIPTDIALLAEHEPSLTAVKRVALDLE